MVLIGVYEPAQRRQINPFLFYLRCSPFLSLRKPRVDPFERYVNAARDPTFSLANAWPLSPHMKKASIKEASFIKLT